jgi:cytochrome P450
MQLAKVNSSADEWPRRGRLRGACVSFEPYDIAFQRDPYPVYAQLRAEDPVHYVEEQDFWIVTRWDDVHELAGSPALTAKFGSQRDPFPEDKSKRPAYANSIITFDPPEHTKFRRPLQKLFNPRAIRSWPFRIETIAERLVGDLVEAGRSGRGDVARQIAMRMPTMTFVELMGLPVSEVETLTELFDEILGGVGGNVDQVRLDRAAAAGQTLLDYCKELLEYRRGKQPEDNVIDNLLVAQREDPDPMSEAELLGNTVFLLLAGIETTDSLLANGLTALLQHPEEMAKLREDPVARIPGTVEEMLRYDGPAHGNFRSAAYDLEIGDQQVDKDARVLLCWAAANRDEALYPDGDGELFRITRKQAGHMGFGTGAHVCLGSQLARLEVRAVLAELVRQTTRIELLNEPTVKTFTMPIMRGRKDIFVTVE